MSDEALNKHLDWLDECDKARAKAAENEKMKESLPEPPEPSIVIRGPYKENSDSAASAWADDVDQLKAENEALREYYKYAGTGTWKEVRAQKKVREFLRKG